MDGTQMPINIAAVASPLKYKISENIRERNAAISNRMSVIVNLLNMILIVIYNFYIISNQGKYILTV